MSGPTLLLEPIIRIAGKRYSGFPSTNSPVNTPTYGAVPHGELLGLVPNSEAQPASPNRKAVATAIRMAAILDRGAWLMAISEYQLTGGPLRGRSLACGTFVLSGRFERIGWKLQSFNDLVGTQKDRLRDGKPEGFCGSQIDNQFELGRLFDGNIAWNDAIQNFVYLHGSAPEHIRNAWTIGDESSRDDKLALAIHCWHGFLGGELNDSMPLAKEH